MKYINFAENANVVRTNILEIFRKEMQKYNTLKESEVIILINKVQENKDARALDTLVNHNLRIVWSIAAHYQFLDNFADVLQNGNIGLLKAINTFDVSRGTKFSTWAAEWIRKYILQGADNESRVVRQGAHEIKAKSAYMAVSMDAPLGNEDGEEKTYLDTFASDLSADNFSHRESMQYKLNCLLNGLNNRDKDIICMLFGFGYDREYSQYEVSIKYEMTEERIRQIKFEALAKIKELAKK